jgi:hypothetical protein
MKNVKELKKFVMGEWLSPPPPLPPRPIVVNNIG